MRRKDRTKTGPTPKRPRRGHYRGHITDGYFKVEAMVRSVIRAYSRKRGA